MEPRENTTTLAVLANDMKYVKEALKEIKDSLGEKYITQEEFKPVKMIAYGTVALFMAGVVGAILTVIINQK